MGMLLLPGDLTTLVAPPLLWKDPRPVPILAFQEMGHPDRAREYVQALFGEGSGVPGASGSLLFQSPLLGIKRVYGALVGNSLLAGLDEGFVAKAAGMPAERGSLPGATAWMKVNPGDLWQALPESTNPAFLHLANSCLRVVAARQNLADLSRDVEPGPALLHDPFVDFSAGCPSGGTYSDSPGGAVRCSLHGDPAEKKQGAPLPGSPLHNLLGAIGSLDVELAFTPGGIRTQMTFRQ